jgi:tetratricopeptide (TPR) repeat protein
MKSADTLLHRAIDIKRQVHSSPHPSLASSLSTRGDMLAEMGRYTEAIPLFREARSIYRAHPGDHPVDVAIQNMSLGEAFVHTGRHRRAEQLLQGALETFRAQGADSEKIEMTQRHLVDLYESWSRPDRAAAWRDSLDARTSSPESASN